MKLEELQQKPDSTKRKILIGVAIVLILILGTWWVMNTRQHLKEVEREGIEIDFPAPQQ